MSKDPLRICDQDDAVADLMRELARVAQSDPAHTKALDRVRAELGPLLETPPPAAPPIGFTGAKIAAVVGLSALALVVVGPTQVPTATLGSKGSDPKATVTGLAIASVEVVQADMANMEGRTPVAHPDVAHPTVPSVAGARAHASPAGARGGVVAPDLARASDPAGNGTARTTEREMPTGRPGRPPLHPEVLGSPSDHPALAIEGRTQRPTDGSTDRFVEELALLTQAQQAIDADPSFALHLLEEHRRRFPLGRLVEERAAYVVDALSRLGRSRPARVRARTFVARWPRSAYRARIDESLARLNPRSATIHALD